MRELERQIGSVCRGIAASVASGKARGRVVTRTLVKEVLGPQQFESELALADQRAGRGDRPGIYACRRGR